MKKLRFTLPLLGLLFAGVALTSMALYAVSSKEYDLSGFNIPVKVTAPDGAEVKKGLIWGEIEGVHVYSADIRKDRFIFSAFMKDEDPGEELADAVAYSRTVVEEEEGFKSYVLEEEQGFIALVDEDGEDSYEFSYTIEKDGRHIEFSQGLSLTSFTLAEVKAMYAAAKTAH